jgi:hypothetical protein
MFSLPLSCSRVEPIQILVVPVTVSKELSSKRFSYLNNNIVHLIDAMFWYMGFKTESQAEKVIFIIHFILFIPFITVITLIRIICIIARYVKILGLQITYGRTKGLLLPKPLSDSVSSKRKRMFSLIHPFIHPLPPLGDPSPALSGRSQSLCGLRQDPPP